MVVNLLLILILIFYPFACLSALIKAKNKKEKKDEILVLITWGIAAIPTGMMILMTIIFGLPPEGYGPMDMFK